MSTAIQRLFDKLVQLAPNEQIVLKFQSMEELTSKKTLIYREKSLYEAKAKGNAVAIGIKQDCKPFVNRFQLTLSVMEENWLSSAVVQNKLSGSEALVFPPNDERLETMKANEGK